MAITRIGAAKLVIIGILCISILSGVLEYVGYKKFKYTGDRLTYQLFFEKSRDPELWQDDLFFNLNEENDISLNPWYFKFAGAIQEFTPDLKSQLSVMQFLLTLAFLLSVYYVTYLFCGDHIASFLVAIFASQALSSIGNRGVSVGFPNSWWSRSLAYPLVMLTFGALYKYKSIAVQAVIFVALLLLALVHPPTIIAFVLCFFLLPLLWRWQGINWKTVFYVTAPVLAASYLILYVDYRDYSFAPEQFKEIIKCYRERFRTDEYLAGYPFKLSILKSGNFFLSAKSQILLTLPFLGYYVYFSRRNFKGLLNRKDFVIVYSLIGVISYLMVSLRDTIFISFTMIVLIPYIYVYFTRKLKRDVAFSPGDIFVTHAFFLVFFGSFYGFALNNYINYVLVESFQRFPFSLETHNTAAMIFLPIFALMAMTFKSIRNYVAKGVNLEKAEFISYGAMVLLGINFVYLILQPGKFNRLMAVLMAGFIVLVMIGNIFLRKFFKSRPQVYISGLFLVIFAGFSVLQSWELPRKVVPIVLKQPGYYYRADDLLKWVESNTDKDNVFFVDSGRLYHATKVGAVGFRLFSRRNVIHCDKVGGWAWYINKSVFYDWCQREKKLKDIDSRDFNEIFDYLNALGVDYFVTTRDFWEETGYKAAYHDEWTAVVPI